MTSKNPPQDTNGDLRQAAEKKLTERASLSQSAQKPLSPAESQTALHELEVHQIEMEMQNDELRKTHVELEVSRERYFDLYDLAPVGYCTLSEKGIILEANLTAASLLGISRNELVMSRVSRFIHKEDQDTYYLHHKQLFAGNGNGDFDLRLLKKDGAVFWAHLMAVAARTADGIPVLRVILSDISKSRQDEESLRESEERYRVLFRDSASIMMLVDPVTGQIQDANNAACEYYGWLHAELCSMNISAINTLPKDRIAAAMKESSEKKRKYFVFKHRLSNGDVRDVEVYSSPIDLGGKVYLYSLIHDITAREAAEAKLKISHDNLENETRKLHESNAKLLEALASVKTISGLLPICASCKKVRDDHGYFESVEEYIMKNSTAQLEFTFCKECWDKLHAGAPSSPVPR